MKLKDAGPVYRIAEFAPGGLMAGVTEGNRVNLQPQIMEHRFRLTRRTVVGYVCETCYGTFAYEVPPEARSPECEPSSIDDEIPAAVEEWMREHAEHHQRMRCMAEAAADARRAEQSSRER